MTQIKLPAVCLLALLSLALLASPALAQDADDSFENADPCRGDPVNPMVFDVYPDQVAPGGIFLVTGKPHDPRTVGPGSDVSFNWRNDPKFRLYSGEVDDSGTFRGIINVPGDFPPGKYILQYAEASPFTSCLEYTVADPQSAAASGPVPGLGLLSAFLKMLLRVLAGF